MRQRTFAGLVGLLLLGTLAGCDGDTTGNTTANAGDGDTPDIRAAGLAFSQCMRERGYDIPDPTFDESGWPRFNEPPQDQRDAAYLDDRGECRKPLDEAARAAGVTDKKQEQQDNLLAYARCMRDNGVNVPDPNANGEWPVDKALIGTPAWEAAAEQCKQYLPPKMGVPNPTKGGG